MRAIWCRATSNLSTCICSSCMSNTAIIAKRRGRTALRGSWAFGTPTSTCVHTTVFAAGLAVDAKGKASRNKQWEQAFAQLHEATSQLPQVDANKTEVAPERYHEPQFHGLSLADLPSDFDWDAMQRIAGMELIDDQVLQTQETESQLREYAEMDWDDLRFDSRFPGAQLLEWPANTGPDVVRYNLPPQSLFAPDTQRLAALRRRHTWKKLAMQNLSSGLLIHELLRQTDVVRFSATASDEIAKLAPQIQEVILMTEGNGRQARLEILEAIETLHKTPIDSLAIDIDKATIRVKHPAIPHYYQDADGDFYTITRQLNEGLKQLLQATPTGDDKKRAFAIAKICHNMLISSASPDLQTFNVLLAGFRRWSRSQQLVDSVIAAFYVHKIRPNEITCREILRHYARYSRPNDFSRFVAKMRGVGDALMLANPAITVNEASQDRLVRVSKDKIFQKVYPTPMVFDALIAGVLRFAGFDRALDIYYEMKADGWGLDVQGLTRLLWSCVQRADWEGGLYVWEEINSIRIRAKTRHMAKAYNHMLSLCSITGNTVAFNQILNELAKGGYDRKRILEAAEDTVLLARKKKAYLAPAWMADNVMIAVSSYVNEAKSTDLQDTLKTTDGNESLLSEYTEDMIDSVDHDPNNKKELWASWLEHEFGERPNDPEP